MNIQDWFPLGLTVLPPCSPRDSQESSPTSHSKSINSSMLSFLRGPALTSIHDYWKNHTFDWTYLCLQSKKSLLFNMLYRFVIAFLLRSKGVFISWPLSSSAVILETENKVCHCFHCFSIYLPWSDRIGRNINNLRYADDTTLMAESQEELKSLLMKVKEESEKVGLKFNIQKTKIMASGLITSWQIDGKTVETVADFIFLGSKNTAEGDCSHEIKRHLLLGIKKQRHYFGNKGPSGQGYGFSSGHVWMWELDCEESWAPKNWCWESLGPQGDPTSPS